MRVIQEPYAVREFDPNRKKLVVGSRVRIKILLAPLKHRDVVYGIVTHIDGRYISVRPMWCEWLASCYPSELEVM